MTIRVSMRIQRPSTTYWNARGRDLVAVSNVMEARGCWGRYTPHHRYRPPTEEGGHVTRISITAAPVIQLPTWAPYANSSREVQQEWDRMITALTRHENQHHTIFAREAAEMSLRVRRGSVLFGHSASQCG